MSGKYNKFAVPMYDFKTESKLNSRSKYTLGQMPIIGGRENRMSERRSLRACPVGLMPRRGGRAVSQA